MKILVLNGSPRPKGNTKQMIAAYFLGLENMGVFTAHGAENGSPEKMGELRAFGASLK